MEKNFLINTTLLSCLFILNIIIKDECLYFKIIYIVLLFYHIYILYIIKYFNWKKNKFKIIKYIYLSILLYLFSYFIILDPNPLFYMYIYYMFFPNFIKSVFIIIIHTYFISKLINDKEEKDKYNPIPTNDNHKQIEEDSNISSINNNTNNRYSYFLSEYFDYITKDKIHFLFFLFILLFFIIIEMKIFFQRNMIWVYFNNRKNTLPIATSKNTTYYITAMIANMEDSIENYIIEMKKLIGYLGKEHIIVSIVENGDSKDKTREYLIKFQNYLNQEKIKNKFLLNHTIEDPRRQNITKETEFQKRKFTHLRIEYLARLRNKCFDLLYEISDLDYNNTKIIYFNDIIFEYEDIINLLSTNNEDYDAVCGLDFDHHFYDTWVSIDLDGNSLRHGFPYFINKEAQDLVIKHKPIRVFSCWNGVIVFNAFPLKDKKIQFRYTIDYNRTVKYSINSDQIFSYESECTYFHIDLFSLGYTKKFINPEVRVAYLYNYYRTKKRAYPNFFDIFSYFKNYLLGLKIKRNKYMSNYKDKKIEISSTLENWYLYNKKKD